MPAAYPSPNGDGDTPRAASRTALLIAAYRARETAKPDRLCTDPHAAALAGDDGMALATRYDAMNPHMELWTAVRTAFIDARVELFTSPPFSMRQVVLLGAGFDTRSARLAKDGVRFFEVDSPASQAEKKRRLGLLSGYPMEAATFVTCNFETDDFLSRLKDAGFRSDAPAFVIWEGVTPYLTESAVRATLRKIAEGCDPGSIVVFDHLRKKMIKGDIPDRDKASRDFVDDLGEPLRFGTDDALPILYEEGFRRVKSTTFDEACLDLTGTYDRARMFRFQSIVLGTRSAATLP